MVLIHLQAFNKYDVEADAEANTIDFCDMIGVEHSIQQELVRAPPFITETVPARETSTELGDYRFSNATSPALIIVTSDARSSVCARFFCTRFVHYFRWKGENVQFYVASSSFSDHRPTPFHGNEPAWIEHNTQCISAALKYFGSNPKLGFVATPVALIYTDCACKVARQRLLGMLRGNRPFLIRWVRFSEDWEVTQEVLERCISVSLRRQALRSSRCNGSVVCSDMTSFLNSMLPMLYQIYSQEPLDGAPGDTLRSFPPVFFTRHGQSEYNLEDRLGGNPDLTDSGRGDAEDIAQLLAQQVKSNDKLFADRTKCWKNGAEFEVWCSQLLRTQNTAQPTADVLCGGAVWTFKSLNEIHAGICEDMTNEEVKMLYPFIQSFRHLDKVGFRYPDGESYGDLVHRLTPLLVDLHNCSKCVVVVAHQAVLRTMLSFFGGRPVEEAVHVPCPQRTVWVCTMNRLGEPRLAEIAIAPRQKDAAVSAPKWEGW